MAQSLKAFMTASRSRRILFTGGGSTGHVAVNLALIPKFLDEGWQVAYVGSKNGIERELIEPLEKVIYFPILTGKFRRYRDLKNVTDPFKVMGGTLQAYRLIHRWKPHVIFSKGGFVSVPVVIGGWLNRIPTLIHESDLTPGLANRMAVPFANKVLTTFPETSDYVKRNKTLSVGPIIRESLLKGDPERGRRYCGLNESKPILLVAGGSLGSKAINLVIRENLDQLLKDFQIVHLCGKGHHDPSIKREGYCRFEYVNEALPDILAMTDLVVSRAGSNMIFEFLAVRKPMLLIPLPKSSSRGDQLLNAESFNRAGYAHVLLEEEMTEESFLNAVHKLHNETQNLIANMTKKQGLGGIETLTAIIKAEVKS
ncbi:UDP-N-acetylglucosamine--N-acetylmuramyl-(pentapeptide) pyrophosphoryl-undecaprenol N-acetylglucosamine transferase [Pullulanibacillus pueri]|uniref:UDP-N-acetylglucosamine--N-acetylmuramyl-(pentapeptide) pyrophosphoryl-undecaprenol N-acetylglucosamine transferase n=1 Tax=Pullulanibacillus pueri TaxID=1437324 RepID=A0A8J2ZT61_9BACL|nr:undecaprenyldiphospho-muramoylpentapeptide beta-N-acetylglucosaminyltransferase [Pullulanibacillus pueri]MBM7681101.1 UDP-N-acetylglucosamine--N-acetylmuramyl-(pentapeptide) pyrophosphoryl-undecaprenol N-acetylglucosamine transferase [Pullulanibacillus pueri]GGH77049.1 UDP-N-acetylglucosamine--N-acetylmuramyl-(pentapeptide) pyrophosphoryl-undecaprenol N-acetylglucosamine transferase 3 [Pullulanibacillus pueri]